MIDLGHARKIAEELLDGLDSQAFHDDEQCRSLICEQREALQRALEDSFTPERYKVAVVGSFKVGKSSFVNALCGQKVLAPVDSNPETAAITVIKYAERPCAEACMIRDDQWREMKSAFDADPEDVRAARYHKLMDLAKGEDGTHLRELERELVSTKGVVRATVCEDWADKEKRKGFNSWIKQFVSRRDPRHYFVDHLVIQVPAPILRDGIELIDTPGLNDTDRYRVLVTEDYIKDVDVILFLTQSGSSYSQPDKDFIVRQLRRKTIKHLRLIITKCDETFSNAVRDAEAHDEEPPTFEEHLAREEARVRVELDKTLDEILRPQDVDEDGRAYFREQLSEIPIDFISSRYYHEGRSSESGIDSLRTGLQAMLQKSERIAKARKTLVDAINRVSDRTTHAIGARLEAVTTDYSAERVRHQLHQVSEQVGKSLACFERKVKREVRTLKDGNEKDEELVEAKIEVMLLRCDSAVDRFARQDVGKHWRTRRAGYWGSLDDIQRHVADSIFPHVELLLRRYVQRFVETVGRIQGQIDLLQTSLATIEQDSRIDGRLQPLALSERFGTSCKAFLSDVGQLVDDQKDLIVRHLDTFVSDELCETIEDARSTVRRVCGQGTTWRQTAAVENFYEGLKSSMRGSLEEYLRHQVGRFSQILVNRAESVHTNIQHEMGLLIEDRLNAIHSNLSQLNESQKATMIRAYKHVIRGCEKARKRIDPATSPL